MSKPLVISILAKSNAAMLPTYLQSLLSQTVIDKKTVFYIRTNDNTDNTAEILHDFYKKLNHRWKMYFDDSSVDSDLTNIENHNWGVNKRVTILGDIRQKSIEFAIQEKADYFVMDIDNIIYPNTISAIRSTNLPVIAPMLLTPEYGAYSNYHAGVDANGYYAEGQYYLPILRKDIKGIFEVPVVHCTYFIKREILPEIKYLDGSYRYEYVVFSDNLRKKGIPQYIDNRDLYGIITFNSEQEHIDSCRQYQSYVQLEEYIKKTMDEKNYEI